MTQTLQLQFQNAAGRQVTMSILDPAPALTAAEVAAAMQTIIDKNVFTSAGGDLTAIAGARIVSRDIVELEVA